MLNVYLTVDVEVWCEDWHRIDEQFPGAFDRYVYGSTAAGDYGLPFQLRLLNEHGLRACFFVEPLFSMRFGASFLSDIVSLIQGAGQEVQLHLHPEWVDEIEPPPVARVGCKRPLLREFSLADQTSLIRLGKRLLQTAGAAPVAAFRAGSFGFNADTLTALERAGIAIDASYNATMHGPDSGVASGELLCAPTEVDGLIELPMSVYRDGLGRLRHLQLGSCSWSELERMLWQAAEREAGSLVILSHNFELLNQVRGGPDPVVVARMRRLCEFLERHRDLFATPRLGDGGFVRPATGIVLTVPRWATLMRMAEQVGRRRFG